MKQLVCSLILSKIDYCNSILISLPASSTAPLQRLQNAAARLVMGLRARDHVTSALSSLHWLPIYYRIIHYRIQYKVAFMMFFIHTHQCPSYLSSILAPLHSNPSRKHLRSFTGTDYLIPRTRTKLGERSFSVADPAIWNCLPETVRAVSDKTAFKRALETRFLILLLFRRCDIFMPRRSG